MFSADHARVFPPCLEEEAHEHLLLALVKILGDPKETSKLTRQKWRPNILNTFLFLKLIGYPREIRAKIPGSPIQKFGFPGLRGTYPAFGPHPFTWKTPTTLEDFLTQ